MNSKMATIIPVLWLLACSNPQTSHSEFSSSPAATFSSEVIWQQLHHTSSDAASIDTLGRKTWREWYAGMVATTSNRRFTIDDQVFVGVHDRLVESEAMFNALDGRFSNLKEFWRANGMSLTVSGTLADFKAGIRAASAYVNQRKSPEKGLALQDFTLPNVQGTGTPPDNSQLPVDLKKRGGEGCPPEALSPLGMKKNIYRATEVDNLNDAIRDKYAQCTQSYNDATVKSGQYGPDDDWKDAIAGCTAYVYAVAAGCTNTLTQSTATQ